MSGRAARSEGATQPLVLVLVCAVLCCALLYSAVQYGAVEYSRGPKDQQRAGRFSGRRVQYLQSTRGRGAEPPHTRCCRSPPAGTLDLLIPSHLISSRVIFSLLISSNRTVSYCSVLHCTALCSVALSSHRTWDPSLRNSQEWDGCVGCIVWDNATFGCQK